MTSGSFYWHFKDRDEILKALIEFWHRKNTLAILAAAGRGPELVDSVLALMEAWVDRDIFDPQLDLSIRSWARTDPALRARVKADDDARLGAIRDMYERARRPTSEAVVAARNLYYMQMGYYALEVEETLDTRMSYLSSYVQSYIGEPLAADRAEAFTAEMKRRALAKTDV